MKSEQLETDKSTAILFSETDVALKDLYREFIMVKEKYSEPTKLSEYDYVWLVHAAIIYFRSVDLMILIKDHETKKDKIKNSIYTLFRSILEDYFYLKLATFDPKKIAIHLRAICAANQIKNKSNLGSLVRLEAVGKYISNPDRSQITSLDGLKKKIIEYEKDVETIKSNGGEVIRLINIYGKIKAVCEEYDKISSITKVVDGDEAKCLEWLYGFIYKFVSGSVHQELKHKEDVLDLLWYDKSYNGENKEVLSLLLALLRDIKILRTPKSRVLGL